MPMIVAARSPARLATDLSRAEVFRSLNNMSTGSVGDLVASTTTVGESPSLRLDGVMDGVMDGVTDWSLSPAASLHDLTLKIKRF
jgi:hypothetical protein